MKKVALTVFVTICLVCQTHAQSRFGIKAGLDFDNFTKVDDVKNHLGWRLGVMQQIIVPAIGTGVQVELLTTQKRLDIDGDAHSLWYLQVPFNLRYEMNFMPVRPYIIAGPYFRWLVNKSGPKQENFDISDWGLGVGAGVLVFKFQVGLRYSWGMSDIAPPQIDVQPETFTISLGRVF